ncbi:MAG: transposase [Candidatus Eremiobacteraeota bacterium]|nr:transposase [Candidatus Eremiobacteraeota bacterium]
MYVIYYSELVEHIPNVNLIGCWAHARRKFDEAVKAEERNSDPGAPRPPKIVYSKFPESPNSSW